VRRDHGLDTGTTARRTRYGHHSPPKESR
jgi:hypothetical protein